MTRIRHLIALVLAGTVLAAGAFTTLTVAPSPAPTVHADSGEAQAGDPRAAAGRITAGDKHTCALVSKPGVQSGSVYCWGNNSLGQLGLGDTANRGDQAGEMGNGLPAVVLARPAVSIAAGTAHTCAVLDDGSLQCWGDNSAGQLGLGDTATRGDGAGEMGANLPTVDVGNGRTVRQVAAGVDFTCALLDNGAVKCWGGNVAGQLGLGDTAARGDGAGEMGDALPAVALGTGRTAIAISAGGAHACAVLDTHALKCWGSNFFGQLGLGDTNDRGDDPGEMGDALPAVNLGTGRTAGAITTGRFHTCAQVSVAGMKCWGAATYRQLGYGDTVQRGDEPGEMGDALPTIDLSYTTDQMRIQGLSALSEGTCALLDSPLGFRAVKCWGRNDRGQMGTGDTTTMSQPTGSRFYETIAIAAGHQHVCAVKVTGEVSCNGANESGQLGLGDTADQGDTPGETDPATPVVLRRTADTLQVSAGSNHTCFLTEGGVVRCAGGNIWGELGQGDTTSRGTTSATNGDNIPAVDLGTGRTATQVVAGDGNTCAILDNGQLKCWGRNQYGNLGLGDLEHRGDNPGEMGDNLPAIDLGTGRTAVEVDLGEMMTCARLDNGTVKCWGEAFNGQLGSGDQIDRGDNPGEMGDNLPVVDLGTGRTAVDIELGYTFACAKLDNGQLKCWGYSSNGQLGPGPVSTGDIGNNPNEMGDHLQPMDLGTGRTVVAMSAWETMCVLLDNSTVKCWGENGQGEAGLGSITKVGLDPLVWGDTLPTVDLGTDGTPVSVAVGPQNSCAILDTGEVKCWGANNKGQLGIDNEEPHGEGTGAMGDSLPSAILNGGVPAQVTVGHAHVCALLVDARVKCWGDNQRGQLAVASTNSVFGHLTGSMAGLPFSDAGGAQNRVIPFLSGPGIPGSVTATAQPSAIVLSWAAPLTTGGSPVTGYRIERSDDNGVTWSVAVPNTGSTTTSKVFSGLTTPVSARFRVAALNAIGSSPASVGTTAVTPQLPFIAVQPFRLADTRGGAKTGDGLGAGTGALKAKGVLTVKVSGRGGTPKDAKAVAVTVTVMKPLAAGSLSVWPCGATRTVASTMDFAAGSVVTNSAVVKVGSNGSICAYSSAATHLAVDLTGAYPATNTFAPLNPVRLADTRPGGKTVDGKGAATGAVRANGVLVVKVGGRSGMAATPYATVLNVTAVTPTAATKITVYPCGTTRPAAGTFIAKAGSRTANMAMVRVGSSASVCIHSTAATHLVVDTSGSFPTTGMFTGVFPARLAAGTTRTAAKTVLKVKVAGRSGVPAGAKSAVLDITATNATAAGGLVVFPCGTRPLTANQTFTVGGTVSLTTASKLSADGSICVYTTAPVAIVVDVHGHQ